MLSSEVDELVHLADRVLVFKDGAVSARLDGEKVTRANIVTAYFGATTPDGRTTPTSGGGEACPPRTCRPVSSLPPSPHPRATRDRHLLTQSWVFAGVLVVALLIANVVAQHSFLAPHNWPSLLGTLAPFVLVAFASTVPILSGGGGIDISVGPQATLTNCLLVAVLFPHGLGTPWVSIPLLLLIGAGVGLVNGLLVVVGRLQPVIATLATFFVLSGLALRLSPTPVGLESGNWTQDLAGEIWVIPGGLVTIGVVAAAWFCLRRTRVISTLVRGRR